MKMRILITTYSSPLARALDSKLRLLLSSQPKLYERVDVHSMPELARRLYAGRIGKPQLADEKLVRDLLNTAAASSDATKFSERFLWSEWNDVVDAWQLEDWESYRDVARLGRKTRLGEQQRRLLWDVCEQVRNELAEQGLLTKASLLTQVTENLKQSESLPFDYCVVDEAQDFGVPEIKLLAALGNGRPNSLFFAGDLGQRIFQPPFSWKSLGVDVRGRSRTLKINYRTSHQIRSQADLLLPPGMADVDGNQEERKGTISAFNGPPPVVQVFDGLEEEQSAVASWIADRSKDKLRPEEIAVFVRSEAEFPRAEAAITEAGLSSIEPGEELETVDGKVSILTMHLAKGLEFRAVAVMACDDEVLPLQSRISAVGDDADLEEVYNTERHLLYVACTRARDRLLVTGVEPASEFLDDLRQS